MKRQYRVARYVLYRETTFEPLDHILFVTALVVNNLSSSRSYPVSPMTRIGLHRLPLLRRRRTNRGAWI